MQDDKSIEDRVNSDKKIPAWAKDIAIKNFKARKDFHEKKVKELGEGYTEHLKQLLNIYFGGFSESDEENKISFDLLQKEWTTYVQKANRAQKFIVLKIDAFENEVKRITETEEQFKKKEA
jgi:hypothetical protein